MIAGPETREGHPRRWLILGVLCLVLLVVVLDNTVLGVAIPSITKALGASNSDIQWVVNAYSLVLTGLLMTTGSLADRFGRKRVLVVGLMLFTAGSAAAAFATEAPWLIAFRAGMAVGAALLMPSTLAVLVQLFNSEDRVKAIAVWTATASLGIALGPVVGGVLLDHFWWGSVFLINVPVGGLAIVVIAVLVPESRDSRPRKPDIPGMLLSSVMSVGLVYGVISLPEHGWGSTRVLAPLAVGVTALTGFVFWERRVKDPMLDLTLFGNPRFSGAVSGSALAALARGGSLFLLTQYLQFVLGYTPLKAGFAIMPMAIAVLLTTPFSPKASARLGEPLTVATGLTVMGAGLLSLSFIGTDSGYLLPLIGLALVGGGAGLASPVSSNALMDAIPPQRAGIASGLNSSLLEFGTSLGVTILGSLMSARFATDLPALLPDGVRHAVGLALDAAARTPDNGSTLRSVKDALVSGVSMGLVVGAGVAVVAGIVAWSLLRRRPAGHGDEMIAVKDVPASDALPME